MLEYGGQGGGRAGGARWGLGGQDAVVCSVCNALQPVRRLAYRALDWNFIQMSIKRPRLFKENAGGVDSNVASSHGVRFSTVASCWRSQRSSVPSTSQSTRPPSGGAFSRFGVLTVRQHTTVSVASLPSTGRTLPFAVFSLWKGACRRMQRLSLEWKQS